MTDDDLRPTLDAVKARSAHRRRTRQVWAGAGCAALVLLGGLGLARAGSRPDQPVELGVASGAPGTSPSGGPGSTTAPGTAPASTAGPARTTTPGTDPDAPTATPPVTTTVVRPEVTGSTTTALDPSAPTTWPEPETTTTIADPTTPPTTAPPPDTGVPMSLADAKALWAAKRPASYTMQFLRMCFCSNIAPATVEVVNGVVVADGGHEGLTIDQLYDLASAIGPEGRIVTLHVDPATGVPTLMALDPITMAADDEGTFHVWDFHAT